VNLLPLLQGAQVVASDAQGDPTLLGWLLGAAALAVSAGVVWALLALKRYLDTRTSIGAAYAVSAKLAEVAHAVVADVVQGMGEEFRQALADGRVTPEERKRLLERAIALGKVSLSAHGLGSVEKVFGVALAGAEAIVSGAITRAVEARIATGTAPIVTPASPLATATAVVPQ
jgi:hypothetical protein